MATKNPCAMLMLAVVTAVSLNTAVSAQEVGSPGSRYSQVTVQRDQAPSRPANIHDHRSEAQSGKNIHDHRSEAQSGTNIHDHRNSPGKITPPGRTPPPRVPGRGENNPPTRVTARYLGQHPSDRNNGWSDGLQGVTHDQYYWFFTQKDRLWKFPISHDLNTAMNQIAGPFQSPPKLPAGVKKASIPKSLKGLAYNHFGDLAHYKGYLFIPLEAGKHPVLENHHKPLLAVFRASTLTYVGSAPLSKQTKAGWVAINPSNGLLYTSNIDLNRENRLIAYRIDYDALSKGKVQVSFQDMKTLFDEAGNIVTIKQYMQGGAFSDDGKHLFLVNGRASSDTHSRDGGISVFDFETGKKVLKSTTGGTFRFEYHPGLPNLEEPEGITYWNLDNRNAPKIKGNLHVILLNNDVTSSDEFWLKHYRVGRN